MMCSVIDADTSEKPSGAPRNEGDVLTNLPRTRPQRSSPRRAAARTGATATDRPGASKGRRRTAAETAGPTAGRAQAAPVAKRSSPRRASPRRKRSVALEDAAPRQGFESDGEISGGSVAPPGSAELMATAAEIVGELAKAGLSTGERLFKDVLSRLPRS
jgi:hypothetical protein